MSKKSLWIISIQTLIIILLFWVLVFYGRDEYEAMHAEAEEEVETRSRVVEENGLQYVQLNLATQKNSGISVQPLQAYTYHGQIKALGTVISVQPLIDYNTQYQQLKTQLAIAETALPNHQLQYQRYKQLNEDDKNVSDKVMQEAYALVLNDQTQIKALNTQIKALERTIAAQWGKPLTEMVTRSGVDGALAELLSQKSVLVQVSYPLDVKNVESKSVINLTPIQDQATPISARFVSQSIQSDVSNIGKTYFYIAPAEFLRIGMRVNVAYDQQSQSQHKGVNIPNNAIVWHGGMAWIYVKEKPDLFLRKPISVVTEIDGGWFDDSLQAGTEVVTRGAQLLLSEEFKFQIKNENED